MLAKATATSWSRQSPFRFSACPAIPDGAGTCEGRVRLSARGAESRFGQMNPPSRLAGCRSPRAVALADEAIARAVGASDDAHPKLVTEWALPPPLFLARRYDVAGT